MHTIPRLETAHKTTVSSHKVTELIFQVSWQLQKNGKSPYTIKNVTKALYVLANHTDLNNPEHVKEYIAQINGKDGYKKRLAYAYDKYTQVHGLTWNKPKYFQTQKLPKIPLGQDIDRIIANASLKLATAISISRDTGLRPIELCNLKAKDIDLQQRIIYPTTAKYGASRTLRISPNLAERLAEHITRKAY